MVNRKISLLVLALGLSILQINAQQSEAARKLFRETKSRADRGDAQSQLAVAGFYSAGSGVVASPKNAVKYYRKAAEQGLAQAQLQLAFHYDKGIGMKEEDEDEAFFWFTKAAEQGLVEAQLELARCYLLGKGTKPNGVEAVQWLRKAATQGSLSAEYYLGKCYMDGTGVSRDVQEGLTWTRRAAEAGFPAAQNALGNCYEKGLGVEKDYLQAYKWFALAASKDDANGPDLRVSMAKAETYLTKEQVTEAQRLAREFKPSRPAAATSSAETQSSSTGTVTVTAEDAPGEVYADSAFMGNTPAKLKLKEGPHIIEVKRTGFKDYRREINVTAGSDLNLRANLERK